MASPQPSEVGPGQPEIRLSRVAKYQVDQIGEPSLLERILAETCSLQHTRKSPATGHFISTVGNYRIVWDRSGDDAVIIIAVFEKEPV